MGCNSCFFQPTPHTKSFLYLTSCGHIVCSNCCTRALSRAPSGHSTPNTLPACLVCHKTCSLALLGKEAQLNKDIMFYFTDPVVVLKKLQQAAEFQRMNCEKQTEWQRQKIILDKITKARKHREKMLRLFKVILKPTITGCCKYWKLLDRKQPQWECNQESVV